MKAVTVYCSSSTYLDPAFHGPAKRLGVELAKRRIALVYGGGGIGLMGELARSAKAAGGTVIGAITRTLYDKEQGYDDCDELIIVNTMQERKRIMMDRGEGFLILPGGVGTYEEFFEVLAGRIVGEHVRPIGVVNTGGYYDPLVELLRHGVEHKFIRPAVLDELLQIGEEPEGVLAGLIEAEQAELDHRKFMPMGGGRD